MYDLIKKYEGCSLKPYLCPADIPTIGWGNTFYEDGKKVTMDDTPITQEYADWLLEWYCLTQIKLPNGDFTYNQKMSLFSLIYNIGQTAFDKSKCKKAIESKDWKLAYDNWDWNKSNGKILKGLIKRREDEKKLFFEGLI